MNLHDSFTLFGLTSSNDKHFNAIKRRRHSSLLDQELSEVNKSNISTIHLTDQSPTIKNNSQIKLTPKSPQKIQDKISSNKLEMSLPLNIIKCGSKHNQSRSKGSKLPLKRPIR